MDETQETSSTNGENVQVDVSLHEGNSIRFA